MRASATRSVGALVGNAMTENVWRAVRTTLMVNFVVVFIEYFA